MPEFKRCPTCGEPVLYVVVKGPSFADRRASPCGHRLPPSWFDDST